MEMLKISKNCIIPKDNIDFMTDYRTKTVWAFVREKKEKGECLHLAGRKRTNSVVYLKSGIILTTDTLLDTLNARMKGGDDE